MLGGGAGMVKDELTQIPVKVSTREKLRDLGRKGMTYDEIINGLIERAK